MPTTIRALVIVALVISPGYVFAKLAGDVIAFAREPGDLRFLLPTITCGTAVHIVIAPWTVRIFDFYRADTLRNHPWELVSWGAVTVFVVPAVLGIGLGRLSNVPAVDRALDKIGLGYIDRMPSAWDFAIRLERSAFVRVHLKDGRTIGGRFFRGSFASTSPNRADLYLEEVWQLDSDGNFDRPLLDNWGYGSPMTHSAMSNSSTVARGREVRMNTMQGASYASKPTPPPDSGKRGVQPKTPLGSAPPRPTPPPPKKTS